MTLKLKPNQLGGIQDILKLTHGQTLYFKHQGRPNKISQCRVTGKPKLWKREPNKFKVPVKYGMYESFYITPQNIHLFFYTDKITNRYSVMTDTGYLFTVIDHKTNERTEYLYPEFIMNTQSYDKNTEVYPAYVLDTIDRLHKNIYELKQGV